MIEIFIEIEPMIEIEIFIVLSLGISSHSEDHRENATRSGKQSEIGRSARPKGFTHIALIILVSFVRSLTFYF